MGPPLHGVPVCYGARSKKILRARRTRSGTDLSTVATPKGVREKNLHHRLRTGGFGGPFFPYGLLFVLEHFRVVRVLEDPVRSGDESRVRGKQSWGVWDSRRSRYGGKARDVWPEATRSGRLVTAPRPLARLPAARARSIYSSLYRLNI